MSNISAPVGVGAAVRRGNQEDDVAIVHRLLESVPETDGGPEPGTRSAFSRGYGVHTEFAIKKFQWRQFHDRTRPPDGRVDPITPSSSSGRTLRRLNEYEARTARPYAPRPPQPPNPTAPRGEMDDGLPLLFTEMWNLINQRLANFPWTHLENALGYNATRASGAHRVAQAELFIAIFWEETGFRNILGRRNSNMWGFGQVNRSNIDASPGGFIIRYGDIFQHPWLVDDWSRYQGRANFDHSIDLAILNLVEAYRGASGVMPAALHGYATGSVTATHSAVNPWRACRDSLIALSLGPNLTTIDDRQGVAIRAALWQARSGSSEHGLNPDLAFPPP